MTEITIERGWETRPSGREVPVYIVKMGDEELGSYRTEKAARKLKKRFEGKA